MRITHLELVSNGEHIGSTPIREQAVNAAKAHANRHGVEVDVIATMEDGSTRKIIVKPDGSIDKVWQREYIDPIPGVVYHNRNGGDYKCISSMSDHSAIMERVKRSSPTVFSSTPIRASNGTTPPGVTGPARQSKPKRPPGRRREPPYPA